jgi:hypothetical protein
VKGLDDIKKKLHFEDRMEAAECDDGHGLCVRPYALSPELLGTDDGPQCMTLSSLLAPAAGVMQSVPLSPRTSVSMPR